jgi:hypothetical protein
VTLLHRSATGQLVQGFEGPVPAAARHFGKVLAQVEQWERQQKVQNPHSQLFGPGQCTWSVELLDGSGRRTAAPDEVLEVRYDGQRPVPFRVVAQQSSGRTVHFYLLQYTRQLGIFGRYDNQLPGICPETELYRDGFMIGDAATQSSVTFQLIASAVPMDVFALQHPPLPDFGNIIHEYRDIMEPPDDLVATPDWYIATLRVRVVRD